MFENVYAQQHLTVTERVVSDAVLDQTTAAIIASLDPCRAGMMNVPATPRIYALSGASLLRNLYSCR